MCALKANILFYLMCSSVTHPETTKRLLKWVSGKIKCGLIIISRNFFWNILRNKKKYYEDFIRKGPNLFTFGKSRLKSLYCVRFSTIYACTLKWYPKTEGHQITFAEIESTILSTPYPSWLNKLKTKLRSSKRMKII